MLRISAEILTFSWYAVSGFRTVVKHLSAPRQHARMRSPDNRGRKVVCNRRKCEPGYAPLFVPMRDPIYL